MALETGTYLNDLVTTNPVGATDPKSAGDDHIRLIKSTIKATFPSMAGAAWRKQTKTGDYTLAATDNMSIISCTNASAATITAAAATVGAAFMCIIRNDSSAAGVLVIGTTKYFKGTAVLVTSDGTNITQIPINGGDTLIHFEELSTLTTIDVTGLSETTYSHYRLHLRNFQNATGVVSLSLRAGAGSIDTGARYSYTRNIVTTAPTTVQDGATGQTEILIGNVGPVPGNFWANIALMASASSSARLHVSGNGYISDGSVYSSRIIGGQYAPASGTPDRIQVRLASDSFVAGQLFVWGVR